MYLTTSRRACSRLGGTPDVIHDPPGHPTCPATARRVVTQASQGGARSECYTATVTTSDGARSKENSGAISECYGQEDHQDEFLVGFPGLRAALSRVRRALLYLDA